MSLFIASLNSGSNGNCYYVGNGREAVFVDAGLSCREIEKRMGRLGLSMETVKAIFISHEHSDHIFGLGVLTRKYGLPVYITDATYRESRISLPAALVQSFSAQAGIRIGELQVRAFPKQHDASDPHSFVVECGAVTVGIFTDIGKACDQVVYHFSRCHAAFLEANYDEEMLDRGRYPVYLKQRIRGDQGHLSNRQACELFVNHRPAHMTHLLLSHLSKDNNDPGRVESLFRSVSRGTQIVIASRFAETPVFEIIAGQAIPAYHAPLPPAPAVRQLSLFA